tara:strand:- start:996 stop:1511 length:516 start_codon:yes stop_codon:yes gene_type:complete
MITLDEIVTNNLEILSNRTSDKWINSKYAIVKQSDNTPKGDFGEAVLRDTFRLIGVKADIINGGKGEFDIITEESNTKFECKLATEDTNNGFQFNGLKKDVEYDYALCLGVSPNNLWFNIWPKSEVMKLTVSMSKGGEDTYKLSARKKLNSAYPVVPFTVENFKNKVTKIV